MELKNTKKNARSEGQVKTITICEHHKVGVTDGETNKNKMRFGRTKTMLEQSAPGSGHTFCVKNNSLYLWPQTTSQTVSFFLRHLPAIERKQRQKYQTF